MLTSLFNGIWNAIIEILVAILPQSEGIPSQVQTAFQTFFAYVNGLNLVLPISELTTVLAIYLIYEATIIIFHFTRFIINLVRGSGA